MVYGVAQVALMLPIALIHWLSGAFNPPTLLSFILLPPFKQRRHFQFSTTPNLTLSFFPMEGSLPKKRFSIPALS